MTIKEDIIKVDENLEAKPKISEEKVVSKDETLKTILIENRELVKKEFERFGFKEIRGGSSVKWHFESDEFKSSITILQEINSVVLEQWEYKVDKWVQTAFGMMAPLPEVLMFARDCYFVSSSTRHLNDKWTHSNIIPGTNGDGK